MKKFRVFDVNTHKNVQYGSQNNLNNRSQPRAQCFRIAHAQLSVEISTVPRHTYLGLGRDNWYALIHI